MPSPPRTSPAAQEPTDLYAIIQDAVNAADVEVFVRAHDDDATVVSPPEGAIRRVAMPRSGPRSSPCSGSART